MVLKDIRDKNPKGHISKKSSEAASDIWGILKYNEQYLFQLSCRNHAINCLDYKAIDLIIQ